MGSCAWNRGQAEGRESGIHKQHGALRRRVARRWLQIRTIGEASQWRVNRFVAQKAALDTASSEQAGGTWEEQAQEAGASVGAPVRSG